MPNSNEGLTPFGRYLEKEIRTLTPDSDTETKVRVAAGLAFLIMDARQRDETTFQNAAYAAIELVDRVSGGNFGDADTARIMEEGWGLAQSYQPDLRS